MCHLAQERFPIRVRIDDAVDQACRQMSLLVERVVCELAEVKSLDLLMSPHSPGHFLRKPLDSQGFQVPELSPTEH